MRGGGEWLDAQIRFLEVLGVRHVIALDVGGTSMKGALAGSDGALLLERRRPTHRERGPVAAVEAVLDFAAELRGIGEREFGTTAAAAGVAVPGHVDEKNGIAVFSANIGWRDVPMRTLLSERLGDTPVTLGHDMRTGGLGEARRGAGRGVDRFLFLALGTGISAAIVIDGAPEPGAHGFAGELGHVVVRRDGIRCNCGQRGCLETVASASAVTREWARVTADSAATAEQLVEAVKSGDELAARVWDEAVTALADGLLVGVSLLDPRAVIIGGGLANAGDTLFSPLRSALQDRLSNRQAPMLLSAELGDSAGCIGAGLLAWDLLDGTGVSPAEQG